MVEINQQMRVYVKEIKSLKLTARHENNGITIDSHQYNLLLPHLSKKWRNSIEGDNSVAVSCFPPFPFNDKAEGLICDYIGKNIKDENTSIFFDNVYEGHVLSCIHGIYKIIDKLQLSYDKCYFISGAIDAQKIYDDFCVRNNVIDKINIIVLNSWERHIALSAKRCEIPEPVFGIKNKEKLLLCFNRILRHHRVSLLGLLYSKNLVNQSYYSFFPDVSYGNIPNRLRIILDNIKDFLPSDAYQAIKQQIESHSGDFPLILNNSDASNTNSVIASDSDYYSNSYLSLVTETFFYDITTPVDETSVFFSEKTFKPIICKHPFILASRPHSLHFLREIGYKTFHPYIDETYDRIESDADRLLAIVAEIERLSKQTPEQWIQFLQNVSGIVEHNYRVLVNKSADDHEYTRGNNVQN